jgi:hypothetical protein
MTNMPHWLNKTPEMVAMDRWFRGGGLEGKYLDAIASIEAGRPGHTLPDASDALNDPNSGMNQQEINDAFDHFNRDWLDPNNPASGGNFWPHIPTLNIKQWLRQGLLNAMHKGLGRTALESNPISKTPNEVDVIFDSEIHVSKLTEGDLAGTIPLITTWVCTAPAGTGSIEVDAVRGLNVVELIIATPDPMKSHSRIFAEVSELIDVEWNLLHGEPPED